MQSLYEIIKEVQVIKEIIKEVQKPIEIIKEVQVIKEIIKEVQRPIEIIKEVQKPTFSKKSFFDEIYKKIPKYIKINNQSQISQQLTKLYPNYKQILIQRYIPSAQSALVPLPQTSLPNTQLQKLRFLSDIIFFMNNISEMPTRPRKSSSKYLKMKPIAHQSQQNERQFLKNNFVNIEQKDNSKDINMDNQAFESIYKEQLNHSNSNKSHAFALKTIDYVQDKNLTQQTIKEQLFSQILQSQLRRFQKQHEIIIEEYRKHQQQKNRDYSKILQINRQLQKQIDTREHQIAQLQRYIVQLQEKIQRQINSKQNQQLQLNSIKSEFSKQLQKQKDAIVQELQYHKRKINQDKINMYENRLQQLSTQNQMLRKQICIQKTKCKDDQQQDRRQQIDDNVQFGILELITKLQQKIEYYQHKFVTLYDQNQSLTKFNHILCTKLQNNNIQFEKQIIKKHLYNSEKNINRKSPETDNRGRKSSQNNYISQENVGKKHCKQYNSPKIDQLLSKLARTEQALQTQRQQKQNLLLRLQIQQCNKNQPINNNLQHLENEKLLQQLIIELEQQKKQNLYLKKQNNRMRKELQREKSVNKLKKKKNQSKSNLNKIDIRQYQQLLEINKSLQKRIEQLQIQSKEKSKQNAIQNKKSQTKIEFYPENSKSQTKENNRKKSKQQLHQINHNSDLLNTNNYQKQNQLQQNNHQYNRLIKLSNFILSHPSRQAKLTLISNLTNFYLHKIKAKDLTLLCPEMIVLHFSEEMKLGNITIQQDQNFKGAHESLKYYIAPQVLKEYITTQHSLAWNLGVIIDYILQEKMYYQKLFEIFSQINNYKFDKNDKIKFLLSKLLVKKASERMPVVEFSQQLRKEIVSDQYF